MKRVVISIIILLIWLQPVFAQGDDALPVITSANAHRVAVENTITGLRDAPTSVAFSPDNALVAAGTLSGSILLFEVKTGAPSAVLEGHVDSVNDVVFSPDGTVLASGGHDHTVRLWDPTTRQELMTLDSHDQPILELAFSPDGGWLAAVTRERVVLWDVASGEIVADLPDYAFSVAFSPDGATLAAGSADGLVYLWDMAAPLEPLPVSQEAVTTVAFSPDGTVLAAGNVVGTVALWDVANREQLMILSGFSTAIDGIAFSPDGTLITALATGRLVGEDGGFLEYVSDDDVVQMWDAVTGDALVRLGWIVLDYAFSPDGTLIVLLLPGQPNGMIGFAGVTEEQPAMG